ncbi:MAG: EAL domain-containing protein, partial [Leptospiraceae bacterium]|nr:EAL domain-containing protein [Leptospiraceae bacterium]
FLNGFPTEIEDYMIVNATISMAHSLGLEVIAEGVETLEQLLALKKLSCDKVQGYFISKPLPISELKNWMEVYPKRFMNLLNEDKEYRRTL